MKRIIFLINTILIILIFVLSCNKDDFREPPQDKKSDTSLFQLQRIVKNEVPKQIRTNIEQLLMISPENVANDRKAKTQNTTISPLKLNNGFKINTGSYLDLDFSGLVVMTDKDGNQIYSMPLNEVDLGQIISHKTVDSVKKSSDAAELNYLIDRKGLFLEEEENHRNGQENKIRELYDYYNNPRKTKALLSEYENSHYIKRDEQKIEDLVYFASYVANKHKNGELKEYIYLFLPNKKWLSEKVSSSVTMATYTGKLFVFEKESLKNKEFYYKLNQVVFYIEGKAVSFIDYFSFKEIKLKKPQPIYYMQQNSRLLNKNPSCPCHRESDNSGSGDGGVSCSGCDCGCRSNDDNSTGGSVVHLKEVVVKGKRNSGFIPVNDGPGGLAGGYINFSVPALNGGNYGGYGSGLGANNGIGFVPGGGGGGSTANSPVSSVASSLKPVPISLDFTAPSLSLILNISTSKITQTFTKAQQQWLAQNPSQAMAFRNILEAAGYSTVSVASVISSINAAMATAGTGNNPSKVRVKYKKPQKKPTQKKKKPCDKVNELRSDNDFKQKMTELKNNTSLNYETGYIITEDANGNDVYTAIKGDVNKPEINFSVPNPVSGVLHSHFKGGESMFSTYDIKAVYELYRMGKIKDVNSFHFSVTTLQGTSYMLLIKNIGKFKRFALENLNNDRNFDSFGNYYKNNFKVMPLFAKGEETIRELTMLKVLKGSGLVLFKGNNNFSDWKRIKAQNYTVKNIDCN